MIDRFNLFGYLDFGHIREIGGMGKSKKSGGITSDFRSLINYEIVSVGEGNERIRDLIFSVCTFGGGVLSYNFFIQYAHRVGFQHKTFHFLCVLSYPFALITCIYFSECSLSIYCSADTSPLHENTTLFCLSGEYFVP